MPRMLLGSPFLDVSTYEIGLVVLPRAAPTRPLAIDDPLLSKPELSSTRYGEKLLVCVIKIERLEMLFSHFGVLYFVVLLRRRKKRNSATW